MKIFFITHTYSLSGGGGGEIFVSSFLREMRKRGHEILVFAPHSNDSSLEEKELGIKSWLAPVFGHHALHKFEYLFFAPKAVLLAKKFCPDVIHAQNDALPCIIGCIAKRFVKKPLVLGLEGLSDKATGINLKIVFALNKFFLPRLCFDKLVSWSEFVKKNFLLKWNIPEKKIAVIPGGIDLQNFLAAKPSAEFKKRFGKNFFLSAKPLNNINATAISFIIRAMKTVAKKYPDARYVIAGGGNELARLEALVKELGLEKNVLFAGWVFPDNLPELYASADFVVHSFIFRASTSIALIESMAAGKAIVATESGEVNNAVKGAALIVEPENPESIAKGIIEMIENPALKKQLGEKARKVALENYSIQAIADKFERIYSELLEKNKK